ncbi:hypothetical protein C1645_857191 [Glomus cerebriforme]|uniref:Uncharacterized protein n=1 Tax=Glomus cerebriforme TaxID=658196 RepID=A0A397TPW1_9GLOM|nr:hypothetical protein C1645_857191 [Glomus cerebriforme]
MSDVSPDQSDILDDSNFDMSIIIGFMVILLTVITIIGLVLNSWIKYEKSQFKNFYNAPKESTLMRDIKLQDVKTPMPAYNRNSTLPIYRKSDSWESYLKMIQTPDKLNDIVRTMKVNHSPSSSISTLYYLEDDKTVVNENISYNNNFDHTLQRESLRLQFKENDDYYP